MSGSFADLTVGSLTVTGSLTLPPADEGGDLEVTGNLTVDGGTTMVGAVVMDGAAAVGGAFGVTGRTTMTDISATQVQLDQMSERVTVTVVLEADGAFTAAQVLPNGSVGLVFNDTGTDAINMTTPTGSALTTQYQTVFGVAPATGDAFYCYLTSRATNWNITGASGCTPVTGNTPEPVPSGRLLFINQGGNTWIYAIC